MSYLLKFKELGRNKVTFDIEVKSLCYKNLKNAVKPYIMSEPDFEIDDKNTKGTVFAGWNSWSFDIEKQTITSFNN